MADDFNLAQGTPAVSEAASYRLYQAGTVLLIAALIYCFWSTGGNLDTAQFLALGTIVLASLPALRWAKNRRTWFPAFEISMLACIAFYAVPLFKGSEEMLAYTDATRTQASLIVLVYAIFANLGFAAVHRQARAPEWATQPLLPSGAIRWVPAGVFLNAVYAYLSIFNRAIPPAIDGSLRALCFGIGIMSTFILARLWGLGQLTRQQVLFFLFSLTVYLLLVFSSLYLISGISLLILATVSFASARRRIPWLAIFVAGAVIGPLHLGKPEMRRKYWDPETNESRGAPVSSLTKLPAFYSEWVDYSMDSMKRHSSDEPGHVSIFDRASLIQMICLSVSEVPDRRPYLMGDSYIDIPALVIPRFLWPSKPSSLLANVRLAVYFNLVAVDDAFSVSIAFGPLAEAYVNFGYFGVGLLGLLMGAAFKRISLLSDGMPQFSALGIFMILLTAWSFQAEQVMATWLSSLFQASVICIGLPVLFRKITVG